MAYSDIQQHFKGLRSQTARRGRRNPFATGFEDDSGDDVASQRSRSKINNPFAQNTTSVTQATVSEDTTAATEDRQPLREARNNTSTKDSQRDSEDEFLDPPKHAHRRLSPAPTSRQRNRGAVALAAGALAYLDDSSDEDDADLLHARSHDRRPSPAPRKSPDSFESREVVSPTTLLPPRHTVASPFAGTKYLEDSDSDSDDIAVSSRQGSTDSNTSHSRIDSDNDSVNGSGSRLSKQLDVDRVEKPKQSGSGVSWRAFSAGRAEQRTAEIEALQTQLRQRGRSISFASHAATDDGSKVPVITIEKTCNRRPKLNVRTKSPPRRDEDRIPSEDEFGGGHVHVVSDEPDPDGLDVMYASMPISTTQSRPTALSIMSQTSGLTRSLTLTADESDTPPENALTDSVDSIHNRMVRSPQAIPEGKAVDHASSPIISPSTDPFDDLSRNSSTRSFRLSSSRPTRITPSRRSSRRSTSGHASASPAQAFLSNWGNISDVAADPQEDDEGQAIGIDGEFIIGRVINHGGFGVVKEVHTFNESRQRVMRAVKIVRKMVSGQNEAQNDAIQQSLEHEVSIWRHLRHPNILRLHAVYDTEYATYCIMDLNIGGTLFDLVRIARAQSIENEGRKSLLIQLAKRYAFQLASALRYLHEDMRMCHRDIKLENCLVDMSAADAGRVGGQLRLCDFGMADFLHNDRQADELEISSEHSGRTVGHDRSEFSSVIGTLEYASPEGLSANRKLYSTAGDMWAFGVVLYALCTGELPFRHPLPTKTCESILQGEWDRDAFNPGDSEERKALELTKSCLEKEVVDRATIGRILDNPWFDDCHGLYGDYIPTNW